MWRLPVLLHLAVGTTVINYKVKDGTRPNAYLGNIGQDAEIAPPSGRSTFQIVKGKEYLKIGEKSGDLRTSAAIDREKICTVDDDECTIDAEILYLDGSTFELFKVELRVIDLNDNNPIFPSLNVNLELSEDAAIGTLLRLGKLTLIVKIIMIKMIFYNFHKIFFL